MRQTRLKTNKNGKDNDKNKRIERKEKEHEKKDMT